MLISKLSLTIPLIAGGIGVSVMLPPLPSLALTGVDTPPFVFSVNEKSLSIPQKQGEQGEQAVHMDTFNLYLAQVSQSSNDGVVSSQSSPPETAPSKPKSSGKDSPPKKKTTPPRSNSSSAAPPIPKVEVADGQVFKCVDALGNTVYVNVGTVQGCQKVQTDAVLTAPRYAPRNVSSPSRRSDVDGKDREQDRKRILAEELANEEKRLSEIKKEFNGGEPERNGDERNYQKYLDRTEKLKADLSRAEQNVEALKREMGTTRN